MLIGLDWGTTHLRAYRIGHDGRVDAEIDSDHGILNVPDGDFEGVFESVAGRWLADGERAPILACGMVGSRQGWIEAPYLPCPTGAADLAANLVPLDTRRGRRVWLVPGIKRLDDDGVPDVARGEETQVIGDDAAPGGIYVLPGTHSKWMLVREGRIVWFATFMTGEVFAVLGRHSILGRLMQEGEADEAAFLRGAAYARSENRGAGGLLKRLFSARTLALFGQLPPGGVRSYLSGLLIGAEIDEALACTEVLPVHDRGPIAIIGSPDLAAAYARVLRARGIDCAPRSKDATARGLYRIACAAGLVT